jgi:hypothetical protein
VGNFYTNVTLRGPDQSTVVALLRELTRRAYVSPTANGFTVIYDAESEDQDPDLLGSVALTLSSQFQCPALALLNHDDDVLWYQLYDHGKQADEYISSAEWWDKDTGPPPKGNPELLCKLMGAPGDREKVRKVLQRSTGVLGYLFALNRHEDLVNALGLPLFAVGMGYTYLSRGELPQGIRAEELIQV